MKLNDDPLLEVLTGFAIIICIFILIRPDIYARGVKASAIFAFQKRAYDQPWVAALIRLSSAVLAVFLVIVEWGMLHGGIQP